MLTKFRLLIVVVATVVAISPFALTHAQSPETASPSAELTTAEHAVSDQSLDGTYQGTLVCAQMPYAAGPLRAPLDINVAGKSATFARPIFNLDGSRVVGSEIGTGSMDPDGTLHLISSWICNNAPARARYDGTLTVTGGTLSGSQTWNLGGEHHTRQCFAAVVKARVEPPTR